jgi:hypothetical protein
MTPTNDQIIREAQRRWEAAPWEAAPTVRRYSLPDFVIEVVRENWTPPEPVDPDVLAYREWMITTLETPEYREYVLAGKRDRSLSALSYLAGARMATERERERAKELVEFAEIHASFIEAAAFALDKYRGEL